MLKRRTAQRFGKALGAILFRDCLATSLAAKSAEMGWPLPYMLGHQNPEIAARSYCHTGGAPEHLIFERHLIELRNESHPEARRSRLSRSAR